MHEFTFLCPAKTCAGVNALQHLPFELEAMGASKPMVIQDMPSHLAQLAGHLAKAFAGSKMTLGIHTPIPEEKNGNDTAVFIRALYYQYQENGFDALIALGGAGAAQVAKALNIAVSLGPDALKQGDIQRPLSPLVYLPTGPDAIDGACASTSFNSRTFETPFLFPNLVMIDPKLMPPCDRSLLLDCILTCIAVGCEVFAFSPAAPARAYAATVISLAESALDIFLTSGLKGPDSLKAVKKENSIIWEKVVQAAVMTGYLVSNPDSVFTITLGRAIAAKGSLGLGQIMAILLPAVLESGPSPHLGQLYLHLSNADDFSATSGPQRPMAAVWELRKITHRLFALSHGLLPRNLAEAGWPKAALEPVTDEIQNALNLTDEQRAVLSRILACAWDGRPMNS